MKKVISLFLVLFLLVCNTTVLSEDNDVMFLDIPWLSNDLTTFQSLREKGYLRSENGIILSHEGCTYMSVDNTGIPKLTAVKHNDYCGTITLGNLAKGKVAGYGLSNITLSFAYDGEYQLIYVKLDLLNADLDDLKQKITKVYGTGEVIDNLDDVINIWRGTNNSCIVLFEYSDGMGYDLCYGRLDADEILSNCKAVPAPDDVSGL